MSLTLRREAFVLLFFLCGFLVFSSGRLSSFDAGQQLQVSVMLALTGAMGDDGTLGGPATAGWVTAPNGRRYQAHDIGNVLLMLPAAWVGGRLTAIPARAQVLDPPVVSRVAASLTCASLAAVACLWMFGLFRFHTTTRTAFLLTLAFPVTTIFLAYARTAWDVLGACCLMCGVLYYSAALLRGTRPQRSAILLAVTLACACSFRFSIGPFLAPAALVVVVRQRQAIGLRAMVLAGVAFALLLVPSLAYNSIRTGSALRPATTAHEYITGPNALTGSVVQGLYGLLVSPNRGLFLFSPVLLVLFALPFVWGRVPTDARRLLCAYGAGSACYVLLISKMIGWGAFGWGPRYLVPVLPVFFAGAALAFIYAGRGARRVFGVVAGISTILTVPSAIVNWHLATTTFDAGNPVASRPYQQQAAWKALALGLRGESLPIPADVRPDSLRASSATFPDLLLARVARASDRGFLAAILFLAIAAITSSICVTRLLKTAGAET